MEALLESGIFFTSDGEEEPIILVNGLFQSTDSWRGYIPSLSRYYRVISYDLANQGKSYRDEHITIHKHVSDLAELMQHFGYDKYNLLGHSYGCRVISEFMKAHPDRVNKVILTGVSTKSMVTRNMKIFETWLSVLELAQSSKPDKVELFVNMVIPFIFSPVFIHKNQAFVKHFVNSFMQQPIEGISNNLRALLEHIKIDDEDMRRPTDIGIPTLIIQGREDYLTPCSLLELDSLPSELLKILSNCGHALTVEARDDLIQSTIEFFDEV